MDLKNKMPDQIRRNFLKHAGFAGLTALTIPPLLSGFSNAGNLLAACPATSPDRYGAGPFDWKSSGWAGALPETTQISPLNEPGTPLKILGTVKSTLECEGALPRGIANAEIEVWQADNNGCYSHPQSCGTGPDYHLYGKIITNETGDFSFNTILPGNYPGRPRHLHLRIKLPDSRELITQLYFEGDPLNATDFGSSDPTAENRIIPLTTDPQNGSLSGTWFIFFDELASQALSPKQRDFLNNPSRFFIRRAGPGVLIVINKFNEKKTYQLELFGISGNLIEKWGRVGPQTYWEPRIRKSGVYFGRLKINEKVFSRKFVLGAG